MSSESGEVYCFATWPFAAEVELLLAGSASEVAPFVSLTLLDTSRGEERECENAGESRFRFSEPDEVGRWREELRKDLRFAIPCSLLARRQKCLGTSFQARFEFSQPTVHRHRLIATFTNRRSTLVDRSTQQHVNAIYAAILPLVVFHRTPAFVFDRRSAASSCCH